MTAPLLSADPAAAADPVVNTAPPQVTGVPQYGELLTADPGLWTPSGLSFSYQWLRDGDPVVGATGAALMLGLEDLGHRMSVLVTATDGETSGAATSAPTPPVALRRYAVTQTPALSGV
ncbi:MAG: hypothetical protein WAW88_14465, partial [Nocardioides sp.]